MMEPNNSWNGRNVYKPQDKLLPIVVDDPNLDELQQEMAPLLAALFQSKHLSLLLGEGLLSVIQPSAKNNAEENRARLPITVFNAQIEKAAYDNALAAGRTTANIEDQIKACRTLVKGLSIYGTNRLSRFRGIPKKIDQLKQELARSVATFANETLISERKIIHSAKSDPCTVLLINLLNRFANRSGRKERLNLFTVNCDRIIEYGAELAGLHFMDRFVGLINPVFRNSHAKIDMHYRQQEKGDTNQLLEGVVHFTKLHGSLDWSIKNGVVYRYALPYGTKDIEKYLEDGLKDLIIYPNALRDLGAKVFPFAELMRDFTEATNQAKSTLFVYGYYFDDDSINRAISEMLYIPSTHLVIINLNDKDDQIKHFFERSKQRNQITLLIGNHFGDLATLLESYFPPSANQKPKPKKADLINAIRYPQTDSGNDAKAHAHLPHAQPDVTDQ